jgi:hypothetical protein
MLDRVLRNARGIVYLISSHDSTIVSITIEWSMKFVVVIRLRFHNFLFGSSRPRVDVDVILLTAAD